MERTISVLVQDDNNDLHTVGTASVSLFIVDDLPIGSLDMMKAEAAALEMSVLPILHGFPLTIPATVPRMTLDEWIERFGDC